MSLISEEKLLAKEKKRLFQFAVVMAIFFFLICGLGLWKARWWWWMPATVSGIFLILGFVKPSALGPMERRWMQLAEKMSFVMTTLILCLTFYLVITPMAILLKLLRKDILALKLDKNAASYWISLNKEDSFRPWEPY